MAQGDAGRVTKQGARNTCANHRMLQTNLFNTPEQDKKEPGCIIHGDADGLRDYQRERVDETLSLLTQNRSVTMVLHPG